MLSDAAGRKADFFATLREAVDLCRAFSPIKRSLQERLLPNTLTDGACKVVCGRAMRDVFRTCRGIRISSSCGQGQAPP